MSGYLPFQLFYLLEHKGIEVPYGFQIALAGLVGIAIARVYKGVRCIESSRCAERQLTRVCASVGRFTPSRTSVQAPCWVCCWSTCGTAGARRSCS